VEEKIEEELIDIIRVEDKFPLASEIAKFIADNSQFRNLYSLKEKIQSKGRIRRILQGAGIKGRELIHGFVIYRKTLKAHLKAEAEPKTQVFIAGKPDSQTKDITLNCLMQSAFAESIHLH
jgi:hypothetical protein